MLLPFQPPAQGVAPEQDRAGLGVGEVGEDAVVALPVQRSWVMGSSSDPLDLRAAVTVEAQLPAVVLHALDQRRVSEVLPGA
ncbi:hypothetical protein AB0D94_35840 [Streptomyces sp. NPDC048255]|uniref:hypothetical protein n=1 Tax=Streptomyces sp. NPDC048255 TaxID=3154713 RepID=UPI0033EB14AA